MGWKNLLALVPRKQQITPCETIAASLVLDHAPEALRDVDCIWFLDNSGSEAGLISGYSSSPDSACLIGAVHIILAALNSRPWFERVPSEVNPSDGLSRDGLDDAWTQSQGWDLKECTLPDWSDLRNLPLDLLLEKFAEVEARLPEADITTAPTQWKIPSTSADVLASELETDHATASDSRAL